jgi:hypothetical protein
MLEADSPTYHEQQAMTNSVLLLHLLNMTVDPLFLKRKEEGREVDCCAVPIPCENSGGPVHAPLLDARGSRFPDAYSLSDILLV